MKKVKLPNLLWYGNEPIEISFPSRWDVEILEPPGFKKKRISDGEITEAFRQPIASPTLEELAGNAKEAVIVFDDMTRPTPLSHIIKWVLDALHRGGIPKNNIRFIPALGSHGAMNNRDFRKKLGDHVVENYAIYNHNIYENCEYLGDTKNGTPVYLNREFLACDLKIAIGCITPHVQAGFGGGGKLVLPGVGGIQSIEAIHSKVIQRGPHTVGMGKFQGNVLSAEIMEILEMSGLQIKIDALINDRGEITDLFVGDPVEGYKKAVEAAQEHYGTLPSPGKDIVVTNAYAKSNEAMIALVLAMQTVKPGQGITVLLADAPEGQICHYLFGRFGKHYGGRLYPGQGRSPVYDLGSMNLIFCTRYPDYNLENRFSRAKTFSATHGWQETLALLEQFFPEKASVAVIPDGTMQYFRA